MGRGDEGEGDPLWTDGSGHSHLIRLGEVGVVGCDCIGVGDNGGDGRFEAARA